MTSSTQAHNTHGSNRIWFKEPWMWLVVGLPLSAVVAGLTTLVIAIQGAETVLTEPHQKNGLSVTRPKDAATNKPSVTKQARP